MNKKNILIVVLMIIIVALIVALLFATNVISFNKKTNSKNTTTEETKKEENNEIDEETKNELLSILGFPSQEGLDSTLWNWQTSFWYLDNGTYYMENMNEDFQNGVIYSYSMKNKLFKEISANEYNYCSGGADSCLAISVDKYQEIAKKFNFKNIPTLKQYNGYYLYYLSGTVYDETEKIEDNVSFKKNNNQIDVIYKIKYSNDLEYDDDINKTIKYTFENNEETYCLYKVVVSSNN